MNKMRVVKQNASISNLLANCSLTPTPTTNKMCIETHTIQFVYLRYYLKLDYCIIG